MLNYSKKTLRSSAILTGSYVAADILGPQGKSTPLDPVENNQLVVLIALTLGSLTSAEVKVEFSDDGSTYYQETGSSVDVSTGLSTDAVIAHTYSATGNYSILIPIVDSDTKVSVKRIGTVTSALMAVDAILAVR